MMQMLIVIRPTNQRTNAVAVIVTVTLHIELYNLIYIIYISYKIFGKTCPIAQGDELVQQDPSPDTARQMWPWQIKVLTCCNIVQLCNSAIVQDTLQNHDTAWSCVLLYNISVLLLVMALNRIV